MLGGSLWEGEGWTAHVFVIFGNDSNGTSTGAMDRVQLPTGPLGKYHTLVQKPLSDIKQVPAAEGQDTDDMDPPFLQDLSSFIPLRCPH